MKGMRYTARQKRAALKMWLDDKKPALWVANRMRCTIMSLYRWKNLYDGTLDSLENRSSRPHTPHPNSHTQDEAAEILKIFKKNPNISYNEAYGIMKTEYAYSRTYGGFYNYILRNKIRPKKEIEKYVPKPYDTPEMFGSKIQIDVKYVPKECYVGEIIHGDENKYFQYTAIDEATRERFLYPYKEHNVSSTLDFVKRAITYFGYLPDTIQTDNGLEFTNHKEKKYKDGKTISTKKEHALDILLNKLNIKHNLIRAYTPRQNGKVERSHRSDQESFYNFLKFKTYEELKKKMLKWNIRYNNRPHSSLRNRDGKRVWYSPLQKREELQQILQECREEYNIRFTKRNRTIKQVYAA